MFRANENLSWIFTKGFIRRAIIGALISAVLAYLITLPVFISPQYESESIIYVPLTILSQHLNQHGIGFGSEKEIDWYIQIVKSNQMSDSLIAEFSLFDQYNQEPGIKSKSMIYDKLSSKIDIDKTRYGSLSIKVKDEDPALAASMANAIIEYAEKIKADLLFANRKDALKYAKSLYDEKSNEISLIKKKLDSLKPLINSSNSIADDMYNNLLTVYGLELQVLIERKNAFEREKKNFETSLPEAYVISKAVIEQEPVWPDRIIIIPAIVLLYLFLIIVFEILRHDISKTKA